MSEEIKQDWRKELEHVVKYRLTTDFVTDRQILTELFDSLLSQAVQAEHDRWANQTSNEHDNKIREIALQKRDEETLAKVKSLVMGYDTKDGYTQLYDQVIEHVYDQLLSTLTTK